jgi:hypothetical protein
MNLEAKPWWYLLEGNSLSLQVFSSMTTVVIWMLERLAMVSPGTVEAYNIIWCRGRLAWKRELNTNSLLPYITC